MLQYIIKCSDLTKITRFLETTDIGVSSEQFHRVLIELRENNLIDLKSKVDTQVIEPPYFETKENDTLFNLL